LPLPPLDEQQKLLDLIDKTKSAEKTALGRRKISEAMKKILLASMTGRHE
jgi:restriction endonuclease S subunit